ncbi:uncharacterized protein BYT42DRAFT_588725 [Radiomyces spectabilis]|uniref:uncharacterized protein n=1 Tax=Radiomyces spectabilis TaxID=64574 RepID=UPI00221F2B06|nr:uncharacterized protein BYT42DRAFT_588725 [Radiomyces spectabilis]KAI8366053.1 hypothetical protein BYT42DRAFT_588725 [Radiomyces spectabilis]
MLARSFLPLLTISCHLYITNCLSQHIYQGWSENKKKSIIIYTWVELNENTKTFSILA